MTGKTCFEDLIWQAFCSIYAFYGKYNLIRWMTGGVTTQEKIPRNSRDSGLQSSADRGRGPWGPSLLTVQADWWRPCAMTDGQWQTKRQTHHFIKLNSSFFMQTLQKKLLVCAPGWLPCHLAETTNRLLLFDLVTSGYYQCLGASG